MTQFFSLDNPCKSPLTKVILALSIATSGSHRNTDIGLSQCRASLIPSPAMATILPWSCNLLISFNLSSGRQPAEGR
jgi:hypothetical protein